MYETILVTLDGTPSDRAIIEHMKQLAKLAHSRLFLLHCRGWMGSPDLRPGSSESRNHRGHRVSGKSTRGV